MVLGSSIFGGLVGLIVGIALREGIVGQDYGAGQWQRPSDGQFVSHNQGFIRWLSLPVATSMVGAVLGILLYPVILSLLLTASTFALFATVLGSIAGLYVLFRKYGLG